jgi:hypothetical protein
MEKRFFFYLFTLSLFAVAITSCKKDSGNADELFEFRANFDDTEKVFSVLTGAAKGSQNGLYVLSLIGIGATESISLNLWSNADDFTAGKTFTIDAVGGKQNVMAYGPNGSTDSTASYYSFYLYGSVVQQLNCTITETTPTGIKGTFSGNLYKNQRGIPQKIEVSNGTFYARF